MPDRPPVVLGIDFSPASEHALVAAIRTARELRAELVLVHAVKPLGAPGLDPAHPQPNPLENESADLTASGPTRMAKEWIERAKAAGVTAHLVTRPGRAADVVVDEAAVVGASTIIVGSHGRTGLERMVLGSVAQEILQKSPIPVLVVPAR